MAINTSRNPKEKPLLGDQNEHLTHKKEGNRIAGRAMLQRSQCCIKMERKEVGRRGCSETLSKWGEGIVYGPA